MTGVVTTGTPSSMLGTSKPCQWREVVSSAKPFVTVMRATSPSRKRRTGPGVPPLIVRAFAGFPAGLRVCSAMVSLYSTTRASGWRAEALGAFSMAST